MAAQTLTYTINMVLPAKAYHAGENVEPFDFNSGTRKAGTISDVILLGKVPNGALITEYKVRFGAQASAASHWALQLLAIDAAGTYSVLSTLRASMTASLTAAEFTGFVPTKVSLSDDRAVQYAVLALNCTTGASETVSFSLQGNIRYLADGSNV